MNHLYITNIHIDKVRHLQDIDIPVGSVENRKHLILTGRNGSGKTSLLEAVKGYLNSVSTTNDPYEARKSLEAGKRNLAYAQQHNKTQNEIADIEERIEFFEDIIKNSTCGLQLTFNTPESNLKVTFENGEYILAYYGAQRAFGAEQPESIKKVQIKKNYNITETPRLQFLNYMLDMKMTQAMALTSGKPEDKDKAEEIQKWFDKVQSIVRDVYEDPSLTIDFNVDTYRFTIHENGREPFDFNTASDGFSAVLDIIIDLMLRMQEQNKRTVVFDKPGIVRVDEIENHLHLELQKRILTYLTSLFPNIQFIVTTHSPFVVNSLEDAVIYDLENKTLVENGLSDVSYSGVVQGYFKSNELSDELRTKFEQYQKLTQKKNVTDEELAEIARLEMYLDEMPDYLMPEVSTEYKRLKLEFENRKDI